jgi:AcrR family transcriptional regulator
MKRLESSESEKRQAILDAAQLLFSRYGYRRASVDAIAAEADVAKGTIYAWFDDKDALFRAVCERVCSVFLARAEEALVQDDPFEQRLLAILAANFSYVFELIQGSPHAQELLDSKHRLGADIVAQAEQTYMELLVSMLEEASTRGEIEISRVLANVQELAVSITQCAHGSAVGATSPAEQQAYLARIVHLLTAGLQIKAT